MPNIPNTTEPPQSFHFPELRAAMRRWVEEAAGVIADTLATAGTGEPLYNTVNAAQDVVYTTGTWRDVTTCISDTPALSRQVNAKVGSLLWTSLLGERELGMDFTIKLIFHEDADPHGLTESAFNDLYSKVDSFLGKDTVEYEATSLLVGLRTEMSPILLDETCSIQLLDQDDLSLQALRHSLISIAYDQVLGSGGIGDLDVPDHYRHAIAQSLTFDKIVGEPNQSERSQAYESIYLRFRDALRAIAAVTPCYLVPWPGAIKEMSFRARRSSILLSGTLHAARYDRPGVHCDLM